MYVYGCFANMYVCLYIHVCVWCPWRSEEGTGFPGTGVEDDCGPHVGARKLNLGPLPEQQYSEHLSSHKIYFMFDYR